MTEPVDERKSDRLLGEPMAKHHTQARPIEGSDTRAWHALDVKAVIFKQTIEDAPRKGAVRTTALQSKLNGLSLLCIHALPQLIRNRF